MECAAADCGSVLDGHVFDLGLRHFVGVVDPDGGHWSGVAARRWLADPSAWPARPRNRRAVTALADGKVGIADLTRRLLHWRVGWQWWAIVVATASLAIVGVVISALLGRSAPPAADFARYTGIGNVGLAAVIIIALVVNGLGEETGWRGLRPIVCYESGDL